MASGFGPLQPFVDILSTPLGMTLVIVAIIVLFIYWYTTKREEPDEFEIETFEEILSQDIDAKFKLKGVKTRASLVQGFDFLGEVDAWIKESGKRKPLVFDTKIGDYIDDPNQEEKPYDLYVFRIWNSNKIFKLLGFGQKKYVFVDNKHIANFDGSTGFKKWNLKPGIQVQRWGGMFVTSQAGEEYLTDISIKRSHENTLTFVMNYSRKIIYLELKHSKFMDKYARQKEIDRMGWEKYKRAEGVDEEGEETED